ncbi:S9 family peptidase [Winogradskyella sp. DF17]|uniref:S9 family peptidase n=1 Tax=Winogradskyella pelagia TaxID=2819984 RepID=A0ABS3T3B9_9FLAO|nr:prolyl oligopeptidase family serine peptidase [Winogradskyella sp. DF17]MBO3116959.1 S9 family peptidase [Winogradskyella sp. DF17]
MRLVILICFLCLFGTTIAQKKVMQNEDKALWNRIRNVNISNSGDHMLYELGPEEQDQTLHLQKINGSKIMSYQRSQGGQFSYDSKHVVFTANAFKDSIREMKRRKVKKKDLPKDTLIIYDIESKGLTKIPNVKSYKMPEKWSGVVAYILEPIKKQKDTAKTKEKDTTKTKTKLKKVSKDNGFHLVIRQLANGAEDTLKYVHSYTLAKEGKHLVYATSGEVDSIGGGVYHYNVDKAEKTLLLASHHKTKYPQLAISESGERIGFVVDADSTKSLIKKPSLYAWRQGESKASRIVASEDNASKLLVSSDENLRFSKNEKRLFFGLRTTPIVQDTTLLDEEIVNVEVWTYDEPRLYTVQELDVKDDKKKAYLSLFDFENDKMVPIADLDYDLARYADEGNSEYALVGNQTPYLLQSQWTAQRPMDMQRVNLRTGERVDLGTKVYGGSSLSPKGKYLYGYSRKDSTWYTYNLKTLNYKALTKGRQFYNELHDYPDDPYSYGDAGWTENDEKFLIYDRYDIWAFDPETGTSENLTKGRKNKLRYRYLRLDEDERSISNTENWLLSTFNEDNKHGGFANYNPKNGQVKQIIDGPFSYGRPMLAQEDKKERLLFTRQSFTQFPNLWSTNRSFKSPKQITDANPQQKDYNWGTAEMVEWVSLDGKPLRGMLIKPENFDPNKKYPMIVNFYEKSSDGLYRHRAPSYGRSTINYPFYASRGYVIFNPDVYYRDGYPGESALNCVIPGITALIDKGFIDKDNIGVQGHSWGGYQIAYLVTKTDIFKAAESGAPVPNMISAYGGIRWWTGLSRQFQYEHTQSRIGGTPWEYPQRYVENSPIFNIDKINTPLLVMHNDADGHVPWYQGIELFVSLRRLGKPSWFLNYNDEPHWPLKMQNRIDFNIRMSQFFDHYLKGAAKPVWMKRGVPALEKGINQGYELLNSDKD